MERFNLARCMLSISETSNETVRLMLKDHNEDIIRAALKHPAAKEFLAFQ
jgi:hypothetical protein